MTDAAIETASRPARARRGGWRSRLGTALYIGAGRLNWAEREVKGLAQIVRPGDTVLDVGAALGMYSVPLGYLTGPTGRVDSFDPQPRNFHVVRILRALTGSRSGRVRRMALGPQAGESTIAVPLVFGLPIFGHGHISDGARESGKYRIHHTPTPVDTVDQWVEREGLQRVAFIKIDVEGFEPSVVEGARAVIDRDRPSLLMEIEDRRLVRYGLTTAAGFLADMAARWPEYRMFTWSGTEWVRANDVRPDVRNYLFATEKVLPAA